MRDDDPYKALEEALKNPMGNGAQDPQPPVSGQGAMTLPPGLCQEAAVILYDFWEENLAKHERRAPVPWQRLPPKFQTMWLKITRVVLEMTASVLLTDIHRYLDQSNGDMGAAFARALRRYAHEILSTRINL